MSKHEEASLILKLYELRRDETMRKARTWFTLEFNPQSMADINNAMFSPNSGYLRMVMSYWDMAAALVNHGAISLDLFNDTNGEYLSVYSKVEPFLNEARASMGPQFMANLQKVVDATPGSQERLTMFRERWKGVRAQIDAMQAKAAEQSKSS